MPNQNNNIIVYVNPDPNEPANPNGGLYSIPPEDYTATKWKMGPIPAATALNLLSYGTVVANIPDDGTGLGGWCYLINLPALQPPPVDPAGATAGASAAPAATPAGLPTQVPVRPQLTHTQVLTSVKALLTRTSKMPTGVDKTIHDDLSSLLTKHASAITPPKT